MSHLKMGSNVAGSNPTARLFNPPSEQNRKSGVSVGQMPSSAQSVRHDTNGGAGDGGSGGGGGGGRGRGGLGMLEKDDASRLEIVPEPQSALWAHTQHEWRRTEGFQTFERVYLSVKYPQRCTDVCGSMKTNSVGFAGVLARPSWHNPS